MPTLKGTKVSLSCVQCFLYHVSYSINVSSYYMAGYFLDSPHMLHCVYHASMMDNLGCFHLLATVNKAAMVMGVQYQF